MPPQGVLLWYMYQPLVLRCFVDSKASASYRSLKGFADELKKFYPIEFVITEFDASNLVWELRNNKYYINDESVFKYTLPIFNKEARAVDAVLMFVDNKQWKQGSVPLRGFKLGRIFNSYYFTATRYRKGYQDTAEHEILHFVDEFVYENIGVRLADIVGVKDFDDDIVHSSLYWQKLNYKYDEVWAKIAPYISQAVERRRRSYYLAVIQALKVKLQDLLAQYNSQSIPEIEIKKNHTTKCYDKVTPIAVIMHIDLGREAGTINEILNTTKSASYNWYIPRHGKYVIEFVPFGKAAWHAGRISNPTAHATKLLGGANNLIDSGEPNNISYGICYEGLTVDTPPTQEQIELAARLMRYFKIDDLPVIAHWEVTDYKPRIVSKFVEGVGALLSKK